jgi:hypothetical protein
LAGDVVLAFPAPIRPMRHLRSTVVMASIASLKKAGRFERYQQALAPEHRDTILGAIAATWLPIEVALAHYMACDTLGLTPEQQVQAGRQTFAGARPTLLGTAVALARTAGFTPWQAFPLYQRFWDRGCDGGGATIVRVGPKDAHLTVVQVPLAESPYFRHGMRGLCASLTELFCTRAYVTERGHAPPETLAFRMQWA